MNLVHTDRRHWIRQAAALAMAPWLPRRVWAAQRLDSDPFALGVASGSPTHDSVVLWTRLVPGDGSDTSRQAGAPVVVRWEMAHDEAFTRMVQSGQSLALPGLGHSVHVEVAGLEPDRWYHYRFRVGEALSRTGRTRTFPAAGAAAQKLRMAYASCQRWEHGYYSAYRHMLDEAVDAVMFLGDYIYEYPGIGQVVRAGLPNWALTLHDYRARYALYKSDPHLQAMHAACPWLVTWDDHEVQNDYAGVTPGNQGPAVANFAARRAAAYQAYYENMPLRASVLTQSLQGLASGAELRLYSHVPFGNLATLYLLDSRQYRDAQVCTKNGAMGSSTVHPDACPPWLDAKRDLLGQAQEQWLERAFATSGGHWNVLGQQTVFGQRDFQSGHSQTFSNDGWDGYSAARTRVTDAMQRHHLSNPVVLGGDVHGNWVGHVKADYTQAQSATLGVEFCGTSISSHGGSNGRVAEQLARNPHFVFADRERRGYGVAEFTPKQLTTTLRVVDDVTQPTCGITTLARFVVQSGQLRVQRV